MMEAMERGQCPFRGWDNAFCGAHGLMEEFGDEWCHYKKIALKYAIWSQVDWVCRVLNVLYTIDFIDDIGNDCGFAPKINIYETAHGRRADYVRGGAEPQDDDDIRRDYIPPIVPRRNDAFLSEFERPDPLPLYSEPEGPPTYESVRRHSVPDDFAPPDYTSDSDGYMTAEE